MKICPLCLTWSIIGSYFNRNKEKELQDELKRVTWGVVAAEAGSSKVFAGNTESDLVLVDCPHPIPFFILCKVRLIATGAGCDVTLAAVVERILATVEAEIDGNEILRDAGVRAETRPGFSINIEGAEA